MLYSAYGLSNPLWVVTEETLDSLQSNLAVSRGEQLGCDHLANKHKLDNRPAREKNLFCNFSAPSFGKTIPVTAEMIASHVPDMLGELQAVALKVMSRVRLGIRRGVSESLQLLHVCGGLHLDEVLAEGN